MTPAESPSRPLRIGELAERVGTTARTIRYYEEIGLLGGEEDRDHGRHRSFTEDDVERLEHILRLRDLLGLSLEDLQRVVEAEDAGRRCGGVARHRGPGDPAADRRPGARAHRDAARARRTAPGGALALESELREREALARRRRAELEG